MPIPRRRVAIDGFFTGPGRTRRGANELLTAVRLPLPAKEQVSRFYKAGTRPALDISTIAIAFAATRDSAGRLQAVRLALGAVAPTPIRARKAEALLEGQVITAALAESAAQAAAAEANPIDDVRASAWYRSHLVRVFVEEVLNDIRGN